MSYSSPLVRRLISSAFVLISATFAVNAQEGPDEFQSYHRMYGEFPPKDPAAQNTLKDYLRGLLLKLYPAERERILKLDIKVFDTPEFITEIHYQKTSKIVDGEKKIKRRFYLALSAGALQKFGSREAVWVEVLGHEWRHAMQLRNLGWTLNEAHSQEFERDADTYPIRHMVKAGIDPRPLLEYLQTENGRSIVQYQSNIIKGILASHPNYEFRLSSIQAAIAAEFEGQDPKVSDREVPENILKTIGIVNATRQALSAQFEASRIQMKSEFEAELELLNQQIRSIEESLMAYIHLDPEKFIVDFNSIRDQAEEVILLYKQRQSLISQYEDALVLRNNRAVLSRGSGRSAHILSFLKNKLEKSPDRDGKFHALYQTKKMIQALDQPHIEISIGRRRPDSSSAATLKSELMNGSGELEAKTIIRLANILLFFEGTPFIDDQITSFIEDLDILSLNDAEKQYLYQRLQTIFDRHPFWDEKHQTLNIKIWMDLILLYQLIASNQSSYFKNISHRGIGASKEANANLPQDIEEIFKIALIDSSEREFRGFRPSKSKMKQALVPLLESLRSLSFDAWFSHLSALEFALRKFRDDVDSGYAIRLRQALALAITEKLLDSKTSREQVNAILTSKLINHLDDDLKLLEQGSEIENIHRALWKTWISSKTSLKDRVEFFEMLIRLKTTFSLDRILVDEILPAIRQSNNSEKWFVRLIIRGNLNNKRIREDLRVLEAKVMILDPLLKIFSPDAENISLEAIGQKLRNLDFLELPFLTRIEALFKLKELFRWDKYQTRRVLISIYKRSSEDESKLQALYKEREEDRAGKSKKDLELEQLHAEEILGRDNHSSVDKEIRTLEQTNNPEVAGSKAWQEWQVLDLSLHPPRIKSSNNILNSNEYWRKKKTEDTSGQLRKAYAKALGSAGLKSPFFHYEHEWSEKLQKILWASFEKTPSSYQNQHRFEFWLKLANRGATGFTDEIFNKNIFPALDSHPDAVQWAERFLKHQLVYDFSFRKQLFEFWLSRSKLGNELEKSIRGNRKELLHKLQEHLDQYFPEASPARSEILENISSSILTNASEAKFLEHLKNETNTAQPKNGLALRLINGCIDAVKVRSSSDQLLFLRYLRGDPLPQNHVMSRFENTPILPLELYIAGRDTNSGEDSKDNLAALIDGFGYERFRRLWNQFSPEVQAALINPLLVSPEGILGTPEDRQEFVRQIVPENATAHHAELEDSIPDFIEALQKSGRNYIETYALAYLFFKTKQTEGAQKMDMGSFIRDLFESQGPVGVALGQRLANLEAFDPETNAKLHDLKDRASPLTRAELYEALRPFFPDLDESVLLAALPLGSASIKVVIEAMIKISNGSPKARLEAIAIYRKNVNEKIRQGGATLREFLKLRIQKNPSRYGFLMPVLENVIQKKLAEAHAEIEVAASQVAKDVYRQRNVGLSKTGWKYETIDARKANTSEIIRMRKITAQRFADLNPEERAEVSAVLLDGHAPAALGQSELSNDRVIIDPDIHSGNFLFDLKRKIIYAFDKGQLIGVSRGDHNNIINFMSLLARTRLQGVSLNALLEIESALETMTGQKISTELKGDLEKYFVNSKEFEFTGTAIVKDMQQVFRLSGNRGIHFGMAVQDWLNQIHNLIWLERHRPESSRTIERQMATLVMERLAQPKIPFLPISKCEGVIELLAQTKTSSSP